MNAPEWEDETRGIVDYYSRLLNKHGVSPRALDWGSLESQQLRFAVLADIGRMDGCSLLDVGCGFADLLDFLVSRNWNVHYTGYDLNGALIEQAKSRFPQGTFEVRDLLAEPDLSPRFDYVVASGIFYLRRKDAPAYVEEMVGRMFSLCRKGLAFNTLSIRAVAREPGELYADPAKILTMCLNLTPRVVLRHDYLPHDFSIYMYKK
ncbi:class I SAM-dependent methyltransferase [Desulfatitalea tepidiphila]|uniref:class I SAM-dependent methyltransferase n=1 Tax=Desulfatitalea tepidiphila TaxID=1185843 RepID=UPI0006B677FF|nr:class I SAM-dependent methyltransferase [Desulfatitalea tepidiphila]